MKSGWKKHLLYAGFVIVIGGILLSLIKVILAGYSVDWTGFGNYTNSKGEIERGKTLWDWMQLLIIPIVLAIGAFFLQRSERTIERETANKRAELDREIAKDRQQEAALQNYIDKMSELLLKEKLRTTDIEEVRDVARTRTIAILRVLDTRRNNLVLQFLKEANLITDDKSILNRAALQDMDLHGLAWGSAYLQGASLVDVYLEGTYLEDAHLEGAHLEGAQLMGASLVRAHLEGAYLDEAHLELALLREAHLKDAYLKDAHLKYARLKGAHLEGAHLVGANLERADLEGANLEGANLECADLEGANLEGANLQSVNLRGADLQGVNLRGMNLSSANLEKANLTGANLVKANLTGANLSGADLPGATMKYAEVTDNQLAQANSLKGALMPDGITRHK